jgi:HprK-related kinase A
MFSRPAPNPFAHGGSLRAATVAVGRFSVALDLRSPQADARRQLADLYRFYPRPGPNALPDVTISLTSATRGIAPSRRAVRALADGHAPYPPVPARWVVPVIEATLNWFLWRHVARVLLLHAAVVERNGRALVLSGPSGVGKSTLCAALVARGWRLLTDEIAMVRPQDGRLDPHPRPVSLKDQAIGIAARLLPDAYITEPYGNAMKEQVAFMRPPRRSIELAAETAAPALVIFPRYTPGAGIALEPVDKARAFMRLIESSANYLTLLETGFETLANLVESCDHYDLVYESLEAAVAAIERLEPAVQGIAKVV